MSKGTASGFDSATSFSPTHLTGTTPRNMMLIDLNNDGYLDYVDYSTTNFNVRIFQGNVDPSITTDTSSISSFTGCANQPSTSKSFFVSGQNLTNDISITSSNASYEFSLDNTTFSSSLTLTPSSNTVASTEVFLRVKSYTSTPGNATITIASTGATSSTSGASKIKCK